MPRNLEEIKNFNAGIISNADPREVPADAPILAYDVDATSPGGVLRARKGDRLKGGHQDHAQLKVPVGITINTDGVPVTADQTSITFLGTSTLLENDYISIDDEVMRVVSVLGGENGTLTVVRGQQGTTAAVHQDGVEVYRSIDPVASFIYVSEDESDDIENMVVISKNGYMDGIYNWNKNLFETDESGADTSTRIATVGSGINTQLGDDDLETDFSSFPHRIKHNDKPSIVSKNNSFFIGCGSNHTTKWIGRIKDANLSGVSGFVLQDDAILPPLEGKEGSEYDKIITYQASFSDGAVTNLTQLNNVSKVFHIGYKKGTSILFAINGDNGKAYASANLPFSIWNICKCVSTKTKLKLWVYSKNNDSDTNIQNPGLIRLITIPDFVSTGATDSIDITDDGYFDKASGWMPRVDQTIHINLAPKLSVPKSPSNPASDPYNYGYDSIPFYTRGTNTGSGTEYTGSQEISDILETVDNKGRGKLWILASPMESDDAEPVKGWFKVTPDLPVTGYSASDEDGAPFACFRFLWCSYEQYNQYGAPIQHIDGEGWSDGGTRNIYFNCKSFSMIQVEDHDLGSTSNSFKERATISPSWRGSGYDDKVYWRNIKRQVPTLTATDYDGWEYDDHDNGFGSFIAGADYNDQDTLQVFNGTFPDPVASGTGVTQNYSDFVLCHGGGPWYRDARPASSSDGEDKPVDDRDYIVWDVLYASDGKWRERVREQRSASRPDWYDDNHDDVTNHIRFKPLPNSLVDLSDLYKVPNGASAESSMYHVVGCFVNFAHGALLEDLWIHQSAKTKRDYNHEDPAELVTSHISDGFTYGRRIRHVKDTSCLWISSGNIENYGAYYTRANAFGYSYGSDGANKNQTNFDKMNWSTTCLNLDANNEPEDTGAGGTVRVFKWFPFKMPNKFTTTLRNKFLSELNCSDASGNLSWIANTNDNDPRYSAIFSTYDSPLEEDGDVPSVAEFCHVTKLNTTAEHVDKYPTLNAGEDSIAANGLCGYHYGANTTNIVNATDGVDAAEANPVNGNAVFQMAEYKQLGEAAEKSLSVEKLVTGEGGLTSSVKQLDDIIPNGPCQLMTFGKATNTSEHRNQLVKIDFNGFESGDGGNTGTIHNAFVDYDVTVYNDAPVFLTNNCSQSVHIANTGPYETTTGEGTYTTRNSADDGDLPWGHTKSFKLEAHNSITNTASSFGKLVESEVTAPEETTALMIGHIWPKGQPAGKFQTSGSVPAYADTPSASSKYDVADYELTLFNRKSTKSAFHCELVSNIDFTTDINGVNNFSGTPTTGDAANKLSVYANSKHTEASVFADITFTGIEPSHPSGLTVEEGASFYNYFPKQTSRWYRISWEFDGYQDSPLNVVDFVYRNDTTDYASIDVKIKIPSEIPPRATRLTLWRRNEEAGHYKRIKSIPLTSTYWNNSTLSGRSMLVSTVRDRGLEMEKQDYDTYTGVSQFTRYTGLDYGISNIASNYLFASHVSYPELKERGKSTIVRSVRGKYSQFDVFNNNKMTINGDVTAMATFNGKLYVFTSSSTIRINPESFVEEDVLHGFGCSSKDGVVVTEYGMYYADRNHIYHHDGASAKVLSNAIDTDEYSGKNVSWQTFASTGDFKALFLPKTNQIAFAVDEIDSTSTYTHTYLFCYHVLKQRWDLKRLFPITYGATTPKASNLQFFTTNYDGSLYVFSTPLNEAGNNFCMVWEVEGDTKKGYQWISKKFSMGQDTVDKRFIKIKIETDGTIATPTVLVGGSPVTVTPKILNQEGAGTYEYKLTGSEKKGKDIQIRWGDGTLDNTTDTYNSDSTIFSIGIIYRTGKVK